MKTLALANHKGGVGKTTTAVHLAAGLAKKGHRVLLVDLDSQAHATLWLVETPPEEGGTAELLTTGKLHGYKTGIGMKGGGLTVVHATPALSRAELELAQAGGGEMALREALEGLEKDFEFAILDTPPNPGLCVLNALCAADGVLVPVAPAFLSLAGLATLRATVARIAKRLRVPVQVLGYLLFAVDVREGAAAEVRDVLAKEVGKELFSSEVRVSTAAKSLPATRRTAWDAGADPRGLEDYPAVLSEVLERMPLRRARRAS